MRQTKEGPLCNIKPLVTRKVMYLRPAENLCVVTLQTPLKFLGKNMFRDQFWGRSDAGKVYPQSILGPKATPLSAS